jgi:hypothetical protein
MRNVPIRVSRKILADVSSGIYRTPANALKEIVSNAFDAGAHRVFISTNAPYFDVFTCEDDGEGMAAKEFKQIMLRIGSSGKRAEGAICKETGRPIIGKIGIGMLSVAQICHKFSVMSKQKGADTYFHAKVDLKQFEEVEKEEGYFEGKGQINLGSYEIEEGLKDEVGAERHYTKIVMEEVKDGFRTKLLEEEPKREFKIAEKAATSEDFVAFLNSIKNKKFNEISQYDLLIWELGLLCPVEYVGGGPLPDNRIMREEISRLKKYDFKVFVDGYEIRKPIVLPTDDELSKENVDYKIYPYISFREKVEGSELRFTGYMFNQRKRIQPAELQGVLIRIKGVAVGSYDRTFLHYPKAEGPMFSQLSGEVFVEKGLEEALNIDRNSFNETHRHLLKLQEFLWNYLGGEQGVFKDIRKRSKERRDQVRVTQAKEELAKAKEAVRQALGVEIKVVRRKSPNEQPYTYNKSENKLTFYSHPFWARNQKERSVQEKIILAVTAAKVRCKTLEAFEEQLLKVFGRSR